MAEAYTLLRRDLAGWPWSSRVRFSRGRFEVAPPRDPFKLGPRPHVLADIPIEVACMSKPWGWRPPGCPDDRYRYF